MVAVKRRQSQGLAVLTSKEPQGEPRFPAMMATVALIMKRSLSFDIPGTFVRR